MRWSQKRSFQQSFAKSLQKLYPIPMCKSLVPSKLRIYSKPKKHHSISTLSLIDLNFNFCAIFLLDECWAVFFLPDVFTECVQHSHFLLLSFLSLLYLLFLIFIQTFWIFDSVLIQPLRATDHIVCYIYHISVVCTWSKLDNLDAVIFLLYVGITIVQFFFISKL